MNTNYHYIITTFTSQENMSDVDIERTLKNCVNLQQHHLEKCSQKAQTEENVNHAKGTKHFLCNEAKLKFRLIT